MSIDPPWRQPRTLADFGGLEGLRPAERKLLEERDTGLPVVLGDGTLPAEDAPEERRVRASFLRWLILGAAGAEGGNHERGIQVMGAFVESDRPWDVESRGLDVTGCETSAHLCLIRTRFQDAPVFRGASLARIDFDGSALPGFAGDGLSLRHGISFARCDLAGPVRLLGLRAGSSVVFDEASLETAEDDAVDLERCEVGGSVLLRDGFLCTGTIRLYNAKVGGNVEGREGRIAGRNGVAVNGEGLRTVGSVLLRHGFEADGLLWFYGARIGRDLDLSDSSLAHASEDAMSAIGAAIEGRLLMRMARVAGTVVLGGAKIGGEIGLEGARLSKPGGYALAANGLDVGSGIHVNAETEFDGGVTLVGSSAGYLDHQPDIWPCAAKVRLNRFRFGALLGRVTAGSCIRWLDKQRFDAEPGAFWPQPWEQCAKVLREAGQANDARAVLIAKEKRQRAARRARSAQPRRAFLWLGDGLLGLTVRYGRRSMLAFAWLAVIWLLGAAIFHQADRASALRPNNGGVLLSAAWQACKNEEPDRLACWRAKPEGRDWPHFDPLVYSLDLALPVVNLQMAQWWTPDEAAAWQWAEATRRWKWVQIILGWALSLLAVAGFSGIVKSD